MAKDLRHHDGVDWSPVDLVPGWLVPTEQVVHFSIDAGQLNGIFRPTAW